MINKEQRHLKVADCRKCLREIADSQVMDVNQKRMGMEDLLFRNVDVIGRETTEYIALLNYATRLMQAVRIAS